MTTNTNVKHFPFSQFFKLSIGHCLGSAHHEYLWCLLYNKNLCLHQICNEILISTCSYDPRWLHQTSFYDPRGYVLLLNSSKQIFVLFTSWHDCPNLSCVKMKLLGYQSVLWFIISNYIVKRSADLIFPFGNFRNFTLGMLILMFTSWRNVRIEDVVKKLSYCCISKC